MLLVICAGQDAGPSADNLFGAVPAASLGAEQLAAARLRANPLLSYSQYFKPEVERGRVAVFFLSHLPRPQELVALHPTPGFEVYHNLKHTTTVADTTHELAKARGMSTADARFLKEVGLLHDLDPTRAAGTAARVPATLKALEDDFSGVQSLAGSRGSVLRERFGWTRGQLDQAKAIIQRTEFPFGATHPNPAYAAANTNPLQEYERLLQSVPESRRGFVMSEVCVCARALGDICNTSLQGSASVRVCR
jgi:hypothetical protein